VGDGLFKLFKGHLAFTSFENELAEMRVLQQKDRLALVGGQIQRCRNIMHLTDRKFQAVRCEFAGQSARIHADFMGKFLLGHAALFELPAQQIHVGGHCFFTSFMFSHFCELLQIG
jgi:hypothetical protein